MNINSHVFRRTAILLSASLIVATMVWLIAERKQATNQAGYSEQAVSTIHVDRPLYTSLKSLVESADAVFTGTVTDNGAVIQGGELSDPDKSTAPYTLYGFKINKVIKGSPEQEIKLRVIGGLVGPVLYKAEGAPAIEKDQQYMVFARGGQGRPYTVIAGFTAIAKRQSNGLYSLPREVGPFVSKQNDLSELDVSRVNP